MANKRVGDPSLPYNPEPQHEEEEKVDPEKFKKVLKVDESEEAQKRQKRRLKKGEEEGDDEDVEEAAPPTPGSDFSELMEDKDDSGSIFDSKSGGKQYRQASTSPSPYEPSAYSTTEDEEEPSTPPTSPTLSDFEEGNWPSESEEPMPTSQESFEIPTGEQAFFTPVEEEEDLEIPSLPESAIPPPQESDQPPTEQASIQKEPEQAPPPSPTEKEQEQQDGDQQPTSKKKVKKDAVADSSLLASQPKKDALVSKKKKKSDQEQPEITEIPAPKQMTGKPGPAEEEQAITSTEKKEGIEAKQVPTTEKALPEAKAVAEEGSVLPEEPTSKKKRTTAIFRRLQPQEIRKKKKRTIPTAEEGGTAGTKQHKHSDQEKPFVEANEENAGIPLPPLTETLPPVQPAEGPAYSKLSPEVHELFEKIGGVMLIQNNSGITTTTVTLNMPDTVFNDAQIVLDKYSTAPQAFNLQLIGSPEAVKAFSDNIDQLSQAFKEAQYNFEVNILSPTLQTREKKPLIRRKASAGGQGGDRGGRGRQ